MNPFRSFNSPKCLCGKQDIYGNITNIHICKVKVFKNRKKSFLKKQNNLEKIYNSFINLCE